MKRFLFAMLALVLAVGCGGADKKNKEAEKSDEGKQVDIAYKVGDYYNVNGKEGVVFEVWGNGRHGKIVSLDEAALPWCTPEQYEEGIKLGLNYDDGKINTDMVMKRDDSDQYLAFVWCRNKGADWYLPAKEEVEAIYNNKSAFNSTLAKYGDGLSGDSYSWSSTEDEDNPKFCAWSVSMGNGDTSNGSKGYHNDVRAVSTF